MRFPLFNYHRKLVRKDRESEKMQFKNNRAEPHSWSSDLRKTESESPGIV
jgi:hypothetical protein